MKHRILFASGAILLVSMGYLAYHFYAVHHLVPREERVFHTNKETLGVGWAIIKTESVRLKYCEAYGISLPPNDFNETYMLASPGRRINEITYQRYTRFQWDRNVPIGKADFRGPICPNTLFIYKIGKEDIMCELD